MSVQDYIDTYYLPGTQKLGTCVSISQINNFPLKLMLRMVARVASSYALHLDTQTHMRIAVECMQGTLFDWCSRLIPIMKKQLSDCKRG